MCVYRSLMTMAVLIPCLSGAFPQRGDRAELGGVLRTHASVALKLEESREIVGGPHAGQEFFVKQVFKVGEKNREELVALKRHELYSRDDIKKILATCAQRGGVLEELTLAVGRFSSCRLVQKSGPREVITWWGEVPFGVLKREVHEAGSVAITELRAFRFGGVPTLSLKNSKGLRPEERGGAG